MSSRLVSSRLVSSLSWLVPMVGSSGCDPASLDADADTLDEIDVDDRDQEILARVAGTMTVEHGRDEPPPGPSFAPGTGGTRCSGAPLPTCPTGTTGPSCAYPCDGGVSCSFRYYCHADDRVAGMAVTRSRMFVLSPGATAATAAAALETWATQREVDLGFPDGLTTTLLQFAPSNNAKVSQGLLNLFRIRQFYRASSALPSLPVVGEGSLLTLEATASGVVAIKGTIIDPRVTYAFSTTQASSSVATSSIRQHVSTRTGIPSSQISVAGLIRVAVPGAAQIGWYGVAYRGLEKLATVVVSANPALPVLPLLRYDRGFQEALDDTVPILVRSTDFSADPWLAPLVEATATELIDGTSLPGSIDDFSGDNQLADEHVVVVDVNGGSIANLSMAGTFDRFLSLTDKFIASQPSSTFHAQRNYVVLRNAYQVVNRVAVGKWDSAVQFYRPEQSSGYAAGTFVPRMLTLYNHGDVGAAVAVHRAWGFSNANQVSDAEMTFPELVQRPALSAAPEIVSTFETEPGPIDVDITLHEFGHAVDTFLAPGVGREHVPACVANCDTVCDANTTDEAYPLDETIAQMMSMWMVRRLYPELAHDDCDVVREFRAGASDDLALTHSPACLGPTDELNLFLRDDDPACPALNRCDRPDNPADDPELGFPNNCDTSDGYNTFSVLQAWWNTLNGLYCEPTFPFTCYDYAPQWPIGCGDPPAPPCVSADEAAGLSLLYALRTNPSSYDEFFDGMTRFVACNYGEPAYEVFNQALCDHAIRSCSEPLPLDCETCGNGIREGSENCDGLDLTVDEVGVVPECSDFPGYAGGTLGCTAACELDFSGCEPAGADDSTGNSGSPGTTATTASSGSESSGGGPAAVGPDGCTCSSANNGPHRGSVAWVPAVALLGVARRRRRRAVVAGTIALAACGGGTKAEAEGSEATAVTSESSVGSSDGAGAPEGWPERWFGRYYQVDDNITVGGRSWSEASFSTSLNIEFNQDRVVIEYFAHDNDPIGSITSTPRFEEGFAVIDPPPGADHLALPPFETGKARAEFHPILDNSDCSSMILRIVYNGADPNDPAGHNDLPIHRGRICLLEPLDDPDGICASVPIVPCEQRPGCCVLIDLCPGDPTPTTCDPP